MNIRSIHRLILLAVLAPATAFGQQTVPVTTADTEQQSVAAQAGQVPSPAAPAPSTAPEIPYADTTSSADITYGPENPRSRYWASAEYLLWWLSDPQVPVLVTGSPAGVPIGEATRLGQPNTAVLFGGGKLDQDPFSGGRITIGGWFDNEDPFGGEATLFFLSEQSVNFRAASDAAGNPSIGRPFFNPILNQEDTSLVSFADPPFALTGSVEVDYATRVWGAEANLLGNLASDEESETALIAGFRYLDLEDDLTITQNSTFLPGGGTLFNGQTLVLPPNGMALVDGFGTRNSFYGGQIGVRWQRDFGILFLKASAKVALGNTEQTINVRGSTSLVTPTGVAATVPGGLLATSTNSGRFEQNEFTVVPEVDIKLGARLTSRLSAYVSYNVLYWSNVARAGDQIDRTVNLTKVPSSPNFGFDLGPNRPAPQLRQTDLWMQGMGFGLSLAF